MALFSFVSYFSHARPEIQRGGRGKFLRKDSDVIFYKLKEFDRVKKAISYTPR